MAFALVGTRGTVVQSTSGGAISTLAWGASESRTANNLLILFVSGSGSATLPAAPSGWSVGQQEAEAGSALASASIFYKIAAGADAAPTVAAVASTILSAALAEFSGNATSSPLDQTGVAQGTTSTQVATCGGVDAQPGELMISVASGHYASTTGTKTISTAYNNATAVNETNSGGASLTTVYDFGYGATTTNASADAATFTFYTSHTPNYAFAVASFKNPANTVTTKTQTGVARIRATATKTQSGVARIQVTTTQNQSGKAAIRNTTVQTQSGIARVQGTSTQTISGRARITATTTQTHSGVARIQVVTSQTQSGVSRVTAVTSQNHTGKASIAAAGNPNQNQTGVARITASTIQTQSGAARITATTTQTQSGISRIQTTTTKTQTGITRIQVISIQTQAGKANISATTTQTISGKASIAGGVVVRKRKTTLGSLVDTPRPTTFSPDTKQRLSNEIVMDDSSRPSALGPLDDTVTLDDPDTTMYT